MIVRPAAPGDAAAIAEIWNRVIDDTAVTFTTARKTVPGLQADIAERGPAFQVAEDDPSGEGSRVIGFATYFPFRSGPGYAFTKEHSIQISEEARRRGAGRALMAALEDAAREEGVHSLWAGISGENPSGVAFHDRIGFAHVARLPQVGRKFDRWMDLVLMHKILGTASGHR